MLRLSWTAPTTNEDGSPLTDLGSYAVYIVETSGGSGTSLGSTTETFMDVDTSAYEGDTVEFYATALDVLGNESIPSNIVTYTVPFVAPAPPENLVII